MKRLFVQKTIPIILMVFAIIMQFNLISEQNKLEDIYKDHLITLNKGMAIINSTLSKGKY